MYHCAVAPFTGAWIEIKSAFQCSQLLGVAPFTGAWIEMELRQPVLAHARVAPFTGAWIEICLQTAWSADLTSRSLHGSVD